MPKHRHYFPGGNTSEGFFSYYAYILPQREAARIFCLKGGPGVGKSTFMERIAVRLSDEGFPVEYLHCSSDPESLDGIVIPALRIALIDGTAPHIVDPKNPGAVDEIVNLGEYWDAEGIRQHREAVISTGEHVGKLFARAYRYLAAAKCMMDDALALHGAADPQGVHAEFRRVVETHMADEASGERQGAVRKRFASAITPLGVVSHADTLYDDDYSVYAVESRWGAGVTELLTRVSDAAALRGYDVEQYYCPMDPSRRIDHLVVPGLKLAFVSRSRCVDIPEGVKQTIDLTPYVQGGVAEFAEAEFDALLGEALFTLARAKAAHDALERYYVPYMDFAGVDRKAEKIMQAIRTEMREKR